MIPVDWNAVWTFVGAWVAIWLALSLLWQGVFLAWRLWLARKPQG